MKEPFASFIKDEKAASAGAVFIRRSVPVLGILLAAVLIAGCLADGDKYEEAQREKDKILAELQELHRSNDFLNQEIGRLYNDSDTLSTQLALSASLFLHDKYTTGLARPRAAAVQPAAPSRPANAGNSRPRQNPGQGGEQSGSRPQGGGQPRGGNSGGSGGGSGGLNTPPPPPPSATPPAAPRPRPSGSVDWGI